MEWGNRTSVIPAIPNVPPMSRPGGRIPSTPELRLGFDADNYTVTGTGTIVRLPNRPSGTIVTLRIAGTPTFVASSKLICAASANIVCAANDIIYAMSFGSGVWALFWMPIGTSAANVQPLWISLPEASIASASTTDLSTANAARVAITGTTTITSLGSGANLLRFVRFAGVVTLTYNATSLILPGAANIVTAVGDTAVFSSDASGNWRCLSYSFGTLSPHIVTSNYTIATSDSDRIVQAGNGSSGLFTVTLPSAAGFPNDAVITVTNIESNRAKALSGFPADAPAFLWPNQSITVANSQGTWFTTVKPGRWIAPTGGITFYVDGTNGNDSNDGLASGTAAFKTISAALNVIASAVDMNLQALFVSVADGTYNEQVNLPPITGAGVAGTPGNNAYLRGDTATPTNCVIAAPANSNAIRSAQTRNDWFVAGFKFDGSATGAIPVAADAAGWIRFSNINIGASGNGIQVSAANKGRIEFNGPVTISAGAAIFAYATAGGFVLSASAAFTLTGTPAFSTCFVYADSNSLQTWTGTTFTGSATGARYAAGIGGGINTGGGGANFFPGNAAGSATSPGWYN